MIYFDRPYKLEYVKLKSITLYMTYKNVEKDFQISYDGGKTLQVKKGHYNIEYFINIFDKVGCKLEVNKGNGNIKITETNGKAVNIPAELLELLGIKHKGVIAANRSVTAKQMPHLTPLSIYVYLDQLDREYNLYNGSPSNLLCIIPLKGSMRFGDIVSLEPRSSFKKLSGITTNRFNFTVKDSDGQDLMLPDVIIELECI